MPTRILTIVMTVLCTLSACADLSDPTDPRALDEPVTHPSTSPPILRSTSSGSASARVQEPHGSVCGLQGQDLESVVGLEGQTAMSLHELVACGGAQTRLGNSLIAGIFLGSKSAFDMTPATRAQLEQYATLLGMDLDAGSLTHQDGWWHVMQPAVGHGGMTFDVQFQDAQGQVVQGNPFRLDSYLRDPWVESSLTLDQMMAQWDAQNTYTFHYSGLGRLGYLLMGEDRASLPNPIVLQASLADFVSLILGKPQPGAFAPFNRLTDAQLTSKGVLDDAREDVTIRYALSGAPIPIHQLSKKGTALQIDGLKASTGPWTLEGTPTSMQYLKQGQLAGQVHHVLRRDRGLELGLVHDFGDGAGYPNAMWSCPQPARHAQP